MSNENGRSGIQVIARAAAVLRALRDDQSGLSLGQIAERVDLPRSTVQRIVGALQAERLVISSSEGRSIRLGPELSSLAEAASYSLIDICRRPLSELGEQLRETVDLSVFRGTGMIFVDQVPSTHRLRTVSAVGDVFPLTTTANGRAALAMLPEERARHLVEGEWKQRGIMGEWPEFAALLDAIRKANLASDIEEHTEGICALGAAFTDHFGEIHAISVPVPTSRFEDKKMMIETALAEKVKTIRKLIG